MIFLTILGCQERDVDINLPYDGDKLVVTSHLQAGSPIEVYLEHTFKPLGQFPEELTVSNATVFIIKDGRDTTALTSAGNGSYVSDMMIEAGSSYVIRATAPGYEAAQSRPVEVPISRVEFEYKIKKDVSGVYYPIKNYALVSLYFKDIRPEKEYYVIGLVSVYKDKNISNMLFVNDNIAATEENCLASYAERRQDKGFQPGVNLVRGECMPAQGNPLSISIKTLTSYFSRTNPDSSYVVREKASKLILRVGKATQNWFDWSQIENNQPTDVDFLFLTPQKTFTNIENGYGLVFASNETLIEIDL
ncbi:DUF4249 family protein [Persicitalea sp.]|uniref:DUF4249 family protein n=1 Tax=Persicitalea sp. TaxID=3100273 RepID=UPI0035932EFC